MANYCPECLVPVPDPLRKLPYVCVCTNAILTTKSEWLIPRKKKRVRDFRGDRSDRVRDSQQRKEERGRQMWRDIHLHIDCDRQWYQAWRERLVKSKCNCSVHFRELERTHPISFESPEAFFESSVVMHNAVNEQLGKPQVSIDEACMLWRHRRPNTDRKRCIVTVAVGYEMLAIHRLTKPLNQAYADRCDADFICLTNQIEPWWGLEKFRTWHFAREYEECLFLDADAIIKPDAPIIFGLDAEVAMHDDYERLRSHDWLRKERSDVSRLSGQQIRNDLTCFNTGFAYTKRSAADMWKRPECDIGTSHCAEQIWAEHQARKFKIAELDSRWNWQWWFQGFNDGVSDAWVVHFANAPNRLKLIGDYIATL